MNRKTGTNAATDNRDSKSEPSDPSNAEEVLRVDERSLDKGESGRLAPGGSCKQRGIDAPRRQTLDDEIVPPGRGSRLDRDSKRHS